MSLNKGLPARFFSSPATFFNSKTIGFSFNFFKKFPFNDVTNFVRHSDPIAEYTGRNVENRIYFKASNGFFKSHSISEFINEIIDGKIAPDYFDLYPTYSKSKLPLESHFGLKALIFYKGPTPPKMLTMSREKDKEKLNDSITYNEEDDLIIIDKK
ncbi:hypothetical protein [Silvanigrella aquatica]|uniref:Uncharacterized protein n=1 Tax=Silvanigrella aquatica TaxID=1915309 RepID=A0A1L4D1S0_9BACT|nr:hypothetical protein [Silvanigrella aquatica]APJ04142.1 hypothetical protein AXG55_09590 [Silvanigrella aquatica]